MTNGTHDQEGFYVIKTQKRKGARASERSEATIASASARPAFQMKDDFDFALERETNEDCSTFEQFYSDFAKVTTPFNKIGVTVSDDEDSIRVTNGITSTLQHVELLHVNGHVKYVHVQKPTKGQSTTVDWVNYLVGLEAFGENRLKAMTPASREQAYIDAVEDYDFYLNDIFGFHVGKKHDKGRNMFKYSWDLVDSHDAPVGLILAGHNSGKIMVMLSGTGCLFAKQGWQQRLRSFLESSPRASISRCDVAYDDYQGVRSVEWADEQDKTDGFYCGHGIKPVVEHKGAWRRINGRGRTLTIGCRTSTKYLRVYEKGCKEGDPDSLWTRFEVEFKNSCAVIPFEMLTNPTGFFVMAYPCLADFDEYAAPDKLQLIKKTAEINSDRALEIIKHQFGKYFAFFQHVYSPQELMEKVTHPDPDVVPNRMKMAWRYAKLDFVTEQMPQQVRFAESQKWLNIQKSKAQAKYDARVHAAILKHREMQEFH